MTKFFKFFEYLYLAFAAFFIYEAIQRWNAPSSPSYLFLGIAGLAIFMYFFRRKFRKRREDKKG